VGTLVPIGAPGDPGRCAQQSVAGAFRLGPEFVILRPDLRVIVGDHLERREPATWSLARHHHLQQQGALAQLHPTFRGTSPPLNLSLFISHKYDYMQGIFAVF
jgi:hypothetical protein